MSTSPSRKSYQDQQSGQKIGWPASFLERTFFGACSVHQNLQKNDLNRYCINCDVSACKYCIASDSHGEHKLLKIYRHVYKDVVPLEDMETLIDCSKIQPYRCNKKMVISLNPLPHCGSGEADKEGSCDICRRKLYEPNHYRFCSISCKVKASSNSQQQQQIINDEVLQTDAPANDRGTRVKNDRRNRRKGNPCRAPFF